MLEGLLSKRYVNDGIEIFSLTPMQQRARDRIRAKLENGGYAVEDVPCPLCESVQKHLLSEKDTYGLPMKVVVCRDCGFVYTSPRLAEKVLSEFYGAEYRELDRVLPGVEAYFELEKGKGHGIYSFLDKRGLVSRIAEKLVVEVGCGAGGVLAYFKEKGFDVIGCDFVSKHLEYGIQKHGLDLHYGALDVVKTVLDRQNVRIGLIIYEQVFEHLPHPKRELANVRNFMPHDALLYLGVPGLRNIDPHYDADFLRFLQLPHLLHFDLKSLSAMLSASGFSPIAGDETVRAVFEPAHRPKVLDRGSYKETLALLMMLEKRRGPKAFRRAIKELPRIIGLQVKIRIERSSLPTPVKERLVYILKKLRQWLMGIPR
jgi:SAM-dependent methyltransferase